MPTQVRDHRSTNPGAEIAPSRLTPSEISGFLSRLYDKAPFKQRLMAAGRCWISPLEIILDEIPLGARHLDMGCGVGFMLALSAGFRAPQALTGVDVDERALALARTSLGDRENTQIMTLSEWNSGPEHPFEVVTLVDVLHHVPWNAREAFLRRLFACVAPGGLLIFKDINQKPWWGAAANFMHDLVLSGDRVRLSPIADVEAVAAQSGLRLVKSLDLYRVYPHQLRIFRR